MRNLIPTTIAIIALGWIGPRAPAAPPSSAGGSARRAALFKAGEKIYRQRCVRCHGADGRGNAEEDVAPLSGEQTLDGLTQAIAETMPEDDPDSCVGKEARAVAAFVLEKFFERPADAVARPRIELARLTVRQYRQAVADLGTEVLGTPSRSLAAVEQHGLWSSYHNHRHLRHDKKIFERTDPVIDFDFGKESPGEKIGKDEFSIQWHGSLFAPDTGEYEIIIHSHNGFRLWLNDRHHALIDAWVRSGDAREHRATVYLIGGRWYPLRIEYFKFKDPAASIHLLWRRPGREPQIVASEYLTPEVAPPVLVASTPFPPDDRSYGYERGNQVGEGWQRAVTQAALAVAEQVADAAPRVLGEKKNAAKLRAFGHRFVRRAFRRRLDPETRKQYVDRFVDGSDDMETSLKRIVLATLLSPRFLYRETAEDGYDSFDVASRLSFVLWDSIPDPWLLELAERGELTTEAQIRQTAQRMLDDPRTRSKWSVFCYYWLRLDRFEDITKDRQQFPGFDQQLVTDLRTSLEKFLQRVAWEEDSSDFRQLLLSDHWYANRRLAQWYGGEAPSDLEFVWQPVPRADVAGGVLTHPLLLSGLAYHASSSPIHRGVFLARGILGRRLKVPPVAVAPIPADSKPDWTTRQRIEFQTKPTACRTCHDLINPLGFPLEFFDAAGRFREKENGNAIDASGWLQLASGDKVEFYGPRELVVYLAGSEETHAAFVQQVFHDFVKQPILAFGSDMPKRLKDRFTESRFHIRKLLVDVAVSAALPANQN